MVIHVKSTLIAFVLSAILSSLNFQRNFRAPIAFFFFLDTECLLDQTLWNLRWPVPKNPVKERAAGEQLIACLWRGSDQAVPEFIELS